PAPGLVTDQPAGAATRRERDGGVLCGAEASDLDAVACRQRREADARRQPPRLEQRAAAVVQLEDHAYGVEPDLQRAAGGERPAACEPQRGGDGARGAGESCAVDQLDQPHGRDAGENRRQGDAPERLEQREPASIRTRLPARRPGGWRVRMLSYRRCSADARAPESVNESPPVA